MVQELNLEIKARVVSKMSVNDVSRLEKKGIKEDCIPIQVKFLDEDMFLVSASNLPYYADYVIFLVGQVLPLDTSFQQRKNFLMDVNHYY